MQGAPLLGVLVELLCSRTKAATSKEVPAAVDDLVVGGAGEDNQLCCC